MQLSYAFDQALSALPQGFVAALNSIAAFLDRLITAPITVTIEVGYGEITQGGQASPLSSSDLAVGGDDGGDFYTLAQVKAALAASGSSAALTSALANFPTSDPTGGTGLYLTTAQEKALGLSPADGTQIDGSIGFVTTASANWDFNLLDHAVSSAYDFFGAALHEIAHAMGRETAQGVPGYFPNDYSQPYLFDLYRYVSQGKLGLAAHASSRTTEYFSLDGGVTNLATFDTTSDSADWAAPEGTDSFDAYEPTGVYGPLSKTDLAVFDALGFNTTQLSANLVAPGDFTGGGSSDILFRNGAGVTYLWLMNGASVVSGAPTSTQVGANWQVAGVGDFNGDGAADILWAYHNAANAADPLNGVSYISVQNGAAAMSGSVLQQLPAQWQAAGVGDFNADGAADILYRNSATGQTYIDLLNGATVSSGSGFASQQMTNLNWSVAAVADFNGDGQSDILWRYSNAANAADPLNGALQEWQMNGTQASGAALSQQPGSGNWQVEGTGDFTGNGRDDILLRYENAANAADPMNGFAYIDFMNGTTVTSGAPTQWQVDNSWAIAGIGDYFGNAASDILWRQSSTGDTYIWQMNGANVTSGAFTSLQAGAGWTVQNG